jgi:hypothetical protein
MTWLVGLFALLIGGVLGLFGGGGSILAVPVLVHVAELPGKEAIAMSLLVVGGTSAIGTLRHARAGNVDWRAGATFAPFAMIGSFLGGLVAAYIPGSILLGAFAVMMLVTSGAMLRGKKERPEGETTERASLGLIAAEGLGIGAFTGLVGAGGGFLVVPTLMLLGGLTMHRAVGTSLLVITAKSVTGFIGYASHVQVDYALAGVLVGFAIVGTLLGAALSDRVPADKLRRGFAYFVLAMGVFMLLGPLELGYPVVALACALTVAIAFGITRALSQRAPQAA